MFVYSFKSSNRLTGSGKLPDQSFASRREKTKHAIGVLHEAYERLYQFGCDTFCYSIAGTSKMTLIGLLPEWLT